MAGRGARSGAASGGARTGRPGLRAGRCGHGQDAGDYASDRPSGGVGCRPVRPGACCDLYHTRCRGTARPAADARRGRRPGAHLPRGRAAAARLLLAQDRRGRTAPARREQDRTGGPGGEPGPAGTEPDRTSGPHRRDRVGQGHPAHPRAVPGGRHRGGARDDASARGDRPAVHRLRAGQAGGGRARLRRPAAADRRRDRGARLGRRGAALPLPPLRGGRVPGRQPVAAAPARRLARRAGQHLRGR